MPVMPIIIMSFDIVGMKQFEDVGLWERAGKGWIDGEPK